MTQRTWYVVGVRCDGERAVLGECRGEAPARRLATIYRQHLEDYVEIIAELAGGLTRFDMRRERLLSAARAKLWAGNIIRRQPTAVFAK